MEPSECCGRTCWAAGWRGSGDESGSYECPATAEARGSSDTHDCGDRCAERSECCVPRCGLSAFGDESMCAAGATFRGERHECWSSEARSSGACAESDCCHEGSWPSPSPSPCDHVCPAGVCDDILDAGKPECAECAACHAENSPSPWPEPSPSPVRESVVVVYSDAGCTEELGLDGFQQSRREFMALPYMPADCVPDAGLCFVLTEACRAAHARRFDHWATEYGGSANVAAIQITSWLDLDVCSAATYAAYPSPDEVCQMWLDAGHACTSRWGDVCTTDHPAGAEYNSMKLQDAGCAQCPISRPSSPSPEPSPSPSPCDDVCPAGVCDDILDAGKPECAACAACHAESSPSPWPEPSPSPSPCDDVCPVGLCDDILDALRATPVHGVPALLLATYTPISGRGCSSYGPIELSSSCSDYNCFDGAHISGYDITCEVGVSEAECAGRCCSQADCKGFDFSASDHGMGAGRCCTGYVSRVEGGFEHNGGTYHSCEKNSVTSQDTGCAGAGSRYTYYEGPTSWSDAREACQARGGDLAMLRNAADDAAAFNAVGPGKRAYIGLSDRGTEGTFVWVDGEPAGLYLNWGPSEPNSFGGTDEDCAGYHTYYPSGQWNDFPCGGVDPNDSNAPIGYVCEVGASPLFVVRPAPLELSPRPPASPHPSRVSRPPAVSLPPPLSRPHSGRPLPLGLHRTQVSSASMTYGEGVAHCAASGSTLAAIYDTSELAAARAAISAAGVEKAITSASSDGSGWAWHGTERWEEGGFPLNTGQVTDQREGMAAHIYSLHRSERRLRLGRGRQGREAPCPLPRWRWR